jgi:ATP-dependent DNA ligase
LALATDLPRGSGWAYEPKFDGYRCLLGKDPQGRPFALSRNRKDLGRYFPELLQLAEGVPVGSVVDGEVVKPTAEGVSFLELQRRLMLPIRDRAAERQGQTRERLTGHYPGGTPTRWLSSPCRAHVERGLASIVQ